MHTALLSARILADNIGNPDGYETALMRRMNDERRMAEVASDFRDTGNLDELIRSDENIRDVTHLPSSER